MFSGIRGQGLGTALSLPQSPGSQALGVKLLVLLLPPPELLCCQCRVTKHLLQGL